MMADTLPHITATLNGIALTLLLFGFALIKRGDRILHRKVMLAAGVVSAAFLVVYLVYHFTSPIFVFRGEGWIRPVYYTMLISHVILAAAVTPMIGITFWRALNGRFSPHQAIARWTLPIWLYVSVTGVLVYALLYHIYV